MGKFGRIIQVYTSKVCGDRIINDIHEGGHIHRLLSADLLS